MVGMSGARAVLRGFRVSWNEWVRPPRPRPAGPTEAVAAFRCWPVFRVPQAESEDLAGTVRRG